MTLSRGVVAMCAAQGCAQIGAFSVAALLPVLIPAWSLSNTEAGWLGGVYYAAYTLAVPFLSSLTDRVDPRWRALAAPANRRLSRRRRSAPSRGSRTGSGRPSSCARSWVWAGPAATCRA